MKKERKIQPHLTTAGVFIMPKIPEISVEVKWKIHFGFFWPEYLGLPSNGLPKFAFPFLTNRFTPLLLLYVRNSLLYVRNSEKELKLSESDSLWLARFDRKFLGHSHIWSTPHVINAILGHYARPFLDVLAGIFWGSQNSLPCVKQW